MRQKALLPRPFLPSPGTKRRAEPRRAGRAEALRSLLRTRILPAAGVASAAEDEEDPASTFASDDVISG